MKKRHSKGLSFFCHPEELSAILEPVLAESGARLCIAEERGSRWNFRDALPGAADLIVPKFYVFHPMINAGDLSSLANLVQVWFPKVEGGHLRMGEIGMLVAESELIAEFQELSEDIYRSARKALLKSFRKGVWGRNSKTGGEHFYKDILISGWAAQAHSNGTVLATQLGDGFVTFYVADRGVEKIKGAIAPGKAWRRGKLMESKGSDTID